MVRILVERAFTGSLRYIEAAGLSTDTKPVGGIITGSRFLAVDTGDVYAYDETNSGSWAKIQAGPAADNQQG